MLVPYRDGANAFYRLYCDGFIWNRDYQTALHIGIWLYDVVSQHCIGVCLRAGQAGHNLSRQMEWTCTPPPSPLPFLYPCPRGGEGQIPLSSISSAPIPALCYAESPPLHPSWLHHALATFIVFCGERGPVGFVFALLVVGCGVTCFLFPPFPPSVGRRIIRAGGGVHVRWASVSVGHGALADRVDGAEWVAAWCLVPPRWIWGSSRTLLLLLLNYSILRRG